jgi:lysine-specific demethylase 8
MFRSHGGGVKQIPRISRDDWTGLIAGGDVGRYPLVIPGAFGATAAVRTWTPESIAARFGENKCVVSADLPARGSPHSRLAANHQHVMTVAEFVDYLPRNPGTYLAAATMNNFPGLAEELKISRAVVRPVHRENLWIGNATRSGLHFDLADGLLTQVYGSKSAVLVPAGRFSQVYPDPELHMKSRVDPDHIDERAFPRFAEADRFAATLHPGDALFIPRLWWHHLVCDDVSISVNAWFGKLHRGDLPATILRAGPAVWRQAGRDFVSLGIQKREFQQRLFSAKPSGLRLYEMLTGSARR